MEHLFNTHLVFNGEVINYEVHFENETYTFQPLKTGAPIILLKREQDEWHCANEVNEDLKASAVTQLDNYLMAQH